MLFVSAPCCGHIVRVCLQQLIDWIRHSCKILDVPAVITQTTQQFSHLTHSTRITLFSKIGLPQHLRGLTGNLKLKLSVRVVHFSFEEFPFLWLKFYPMCTLSLKYLPDMVNVFFKCFAIDNDVVNIRDTHFISKTIKTMFHKPLKLPWCIFQTHREPNPFVKSPGRDKSCLVPTFSAYKTLMISLPLIK